MTIRRNKTYHTLVTDERLDKDRLAHDDDSFILTASAEVEPWTERSCQQYIFKAEM